MAQIADITRSDSNLDPNLKATGPENSPLSFGEIWNMNFGFLGIQFGWGLQLANMSAIYTKLGASPENIPILWLAGPVTGLLVQPFVGAMSDRTWCVLGRRRPYFLTGAILASVALVLMPASPSLYFAAALLWILDSSINISMEPFRAFVADKLAPAQRTTGFIMQSFFIGIGATMANALPLIFHKLGITGSAANGVPLTIDYSFKIGAAMFLVCVLWTVISTRENPPQQLINSDSARGGRDDIEVSETGKITPKASTGTVSKTNKSIFAEVLSEIPQALKEMPRTMKQLAVVQIFTWLGLFCMWMFFGLTCAYHVFKAPGPNSELFDRATEWAGWCFAIYSIVCFLVAFLLPRLAAILSRKIVHCLALAAGGLSLVSVLFIHDPFQLQFTMVGVGIAWASVLAMPYAMLAGAVPANRTGVYMGVFNFFIVIPEIVASLGFKHLVAALNNEPVWVVVMGGISLLAAAVFTLGVDDPGSK